MSAFEISVVVFNSFGRTLDTIFSGEIRRVGTPIFIAPTSVPELVFTGAAIDIRPISSS